MNLIMYEFYHNVLVDLLNNLELEYTRNMCKKEMENIKKDCLKNAKKIGFYSEELENSFNYPEQTNFMMLSSGVEVKIPKSIRQEFAGIEKGTVLRYYNPVEILEIRQSRLTKMEKKLLKFYKDLKNIDIKAYPYLDINKYIKLILIEKLYNQNMYKDQIEFMTIYCNKMGVDGTFDIYGKKLQLPKKDINNHIRLVGQEVIDEIKVANPKAFEFNPEETNQIVIRKK